MSAQHTPGPWWHYSHYDKMGHCFRIGMPTGTIEVRTDNGQADADLVLAAPDMLDTFDGIRDNICKSMQSHRMAGNLETAALMRMTLDAIDQAIAKARPA